MTGTLMLSGGHEHTPGCRSIDRALLASVESVAPRVAVVPAAPSARRQPASAIRALRYWSQLGVTVDVIAVDRLAAHADPPAALREADLIVVTGGHPTQLVTVTATTLWPHIVSCWRRGVTLSGSSAGAMALCEWRQHLAPPHPLRFVRGSGLVPDVAAAPHFNRPVVRRWTLAASRARPHLTILGLDERSAVIGRDGRYTVHGTGAVTIVRAGVGTRYTAGSRLHIGVDGSWQTTRFPHPWAPVGATSPRPVVGAP